MTHVLILNPPRQDNGGGTLFNNATLSLGSFLHQHGISAWVASLRGPHWLSDLDTLLTTHRPQLVAISCKWWDTLYGATEVARLVKQRLPGVMVVCGGQTATYFAKDIVKHTAFDAVIHGDGELPLLQLAKGQPECNLTYKDGTHLPHTYVQKSKDLLGYVADLSQIASPLLLKSAGFDVPYIWTGKGCRLTCLYCAGSALGHKTLFGRSGYLYRPHEQLISDMATLAPWSNNTIMFDFDPIADPDKRDYYLDLFAQLPQQHYHLHFYCWSIPDAAMIDAIAKTFISAFISLDAQAYSEPHRQRLAKQRMIKPFQSDAAFEAAFEQMAQHANVDGGLYGIVGLPGETIDDTQRALHWVAQLLARFDGVIGELDITPLATEPGSLVHRNPDKYNMQLLRRSFQDYMRFNEHKFYNQSGIHEQPYSPYLPHPYGLHEKNQPPQRVYQDYQRFRAVIDQHFQSRYQQALDRPLEIDQRGQATLVLQNRSNRRHVWDQIVWFCAQAQEQGCLSLCVDARNAFINAPDEDVLRLNHVHDYTLDRLNGLKEQIDAGEFTLSILASEHQFWGVFEQLGLPIQRFKSDTAPTLSSANTPAHEASGHYPALSGEA